MPETLAEIRSGFVWNAKAARWQRGGRFVSEAALKAALVGYADRAGAELRDLARQVARGEVSIPEWQVQTAGRIKNARLAMTAAAKGGFRNLTPSDYGRLGAHVRGQLAYLQQFALDVESGKLSEGRIVARAALYAAGAAGWYENERRRAAGAVYAEERRVLGNAEHCSDCVREAGRGWQPAGTLAPIGRSACRANCRCRFEFRGPKEKAAEPKAEKGPDVPPAPPAPPVAATPQEWLAGLTPAERSGVDRFQGGHFRRMREYQAGIVKPGDADYSFVKESVEGMDAAFAKAPPWAGTAYRGLKNVLPSDAAVFRPGAVVRLDAHSSFSVDEAVARRFAADTVVKGRPGIVLVGKMLNGVDIRPIDDFEQEVVGRKGQRFVVTSVERKTVPPATAGGEPADMIFVHMEERPARPRKPRA